MAGPGLDPLFLCGRPQRSPLPGFLRRGGVAPPTRRVDQFAGLGEEISPLPGTRSFVGVPLVGTLWLLPNLGDHKGRPYIHPSNPFVACSVGEGRGPEPPPRRISSLFPLALTHPQPFPLPTNTLTRLPSNPFAACSMGEGRGPEPPPRRISVSPSFPHKATVDRKTELLRLSFIGGRRGPGGG